jgi:hypothetical protein
VGGKSDDHVRAEDLSRLLHRHVVLSQVHAVGIARPGEIRVVVDDEQGAVGVAEAAEGLRRAFDLVPAQRLLAQLDDVDAAAQRRPQQRFGLLPARQRLADEVEAGGAQPLAPQRAVGLGGCQAHRSIMACEACRRGSIGGVREPRASLDAEAERAASRSPTVWT